MRLYLVQHGEAVSEDVDPDRPLSDAGRADVARVAGFLAEAGVTVDRVLHSGKTRARQTADAFAAALAPGAVVAQTEGGIAPKDSTDWLAGAAASWTDDVLVVGHLPFMGKLVSRLIAGDEDAGIAAFTPGTVVCLERNDDAGSWAVASIVGPTLFNRASRGV